MKEPWHDETSAVESSMSGSYATGAIIPSCTGAHEMQAPRRCCASQTCATVGNSASLTTSVVRLPEKSRALATALVASDTELNTAMSGGVAPMGAAQAALGCTRSPIQASQSIPRAFHESR